MTGRAVRRAFVLAWLSLGLFALEAQSATVVQVRVGPHPDFTRVVFELDAPAGYQVAKRASGAGGAPEIVVTLEASSRARSITSRSKLVDVVSIDQGVGQAVARIRLHKPGLRLREMILADPPRIVLDVMGEEAEAVARPPARAQAPAPKPKVVEAAPPKPPAPKPPVAPPSPPEPEVSAEEPPKPPAPKAPAVPPPPEPEEPELPEVAPAAPEDSSRLKRRPPIPGLEEPRPGAPERAEAAPGEPESQKGDAPPGIVARRLDREAAKPPAAPAAPRPAAREAPAPRRVRAEPERAPFELRSNVVAIAAIAVGALIVVVAVIVFARRRSLPNDADVMVLADAGSDAAPVPAEGFAMDGSGLGAEEEAAGSPFTAMGEGTTSPEPGLFDELEKGESAMRTESQGLSSAGDELRAPPKFSGEDESDLARVVRELERRIAHLETRLDESIDARERLERQVAAQTEELRVQRAAIARTQRALRGLSRSEEEQATEPALRDPAKPSFSGN